MYIEKYRKKYFATKIIIKNYMDIDFISYSLTHTLEFESFFLNQFSILMDDFLSPHRQIHDIQMINMKWTIKNHYISIKMSICLNFCVFMCERMKISGENNRNSIEKMDKCVFFWFAILLF